MVGLPYIGTVAACAGKMIALQSPGDATLAEKFNWGHVLRHEYTHVINLQQTDFNIPHWFTESLAMRSEQSARPASWDKVLLSRHGENKLFDLDSINFGFIRPTSDTDWTLAYFQASLYADFMVKKYGSNAPARLLRAYSTNLGTPAALKRTFDVEVKPFEAGYREHVAATVADIKSKGEKRPPDLDVKACQKKAAEAIEAKDATAALKWGWEAVHRDATDAASQRLLGEAYGLAKRRDRAVEHLQFAIQLDPRDEAASAALKRVNESNAAQK
jgi:hypothetical protein